METVLLVNFQDRILLDCVRRALLPLRLNLRVVEPAEFELIKYPERGTCLYRCGSERFLLQVIAPEHKAALFGKAGGA